MRQIGNISNVVDAYIEEVSHSDTSVSFTGEDAPGTDNLKIRRVYLVDEASRPISYGYINQTIGVCVEYEVLADVPAYTHGFNLYNSSSVHIFTSHDDTSVKEDTKRGLYRTIAWLPANLLQSSDYFFTFAFMQYNPFRVLFHSQYLIRIHMMDDLNAPTRNVNYNGELPGVIRPIIHWNSRQTI